MRSSIRIPLLSLVALGALAAASGGVPQADAELRFRFRGHIGGRVQVRAPRIRYVPRPVVRWWPSYVVYHNHADVYEPQPSYVVPQQPGGPSSYQVAPVRPPLTKLAVGGLIGLSEISDGAGEASVSRSERGLVVLGRLADHWLVEGSLRQSFDHITSERRSYAGVGLVAEIVPQSTLTPYALVGVGKDTNSDSAYAELGGGLRLNLGPRLQLNADLRTGSLAEFAEQGGIQAADPQDLRYGKFQLAALIRF